MGGDAFSVVDLTDDHLTLVKQAISRWKSGHPGTTPGFASYQDPQLARLLWLEWWMDWALKHCVQPAFAWS